MIELRDVTVRSGDYCLEGISFQVQAGAYAVLMGRTGIGKTTLLEAICGLRRLVRGCVLLGGVDVSTWAPGDRRIGYMPQDLALFPTMTVQQHLEFALRLQRTPEMDIKALSMILARIEVDYVAQIYYGQEVTVQTGIEKVGNSSFVVWHEAYQNQQLVARGKAVQVHFDFAQQKSMPLPDDIRQQLLAHLRT